MSSRRQMLEFLSLSRLPSAFQEVEYLESSGTQCIDSGVISSTDIRTKLKVLFTSLNNNYNRLLGTGGIWGSQYGIRSQTLNGGKFYSELPSLTTLESISSLDVVVNTLYEIDFNNNYDFIVNNSTSSFSNVSQQTGSQNIWILWQNNRGGCSAKLYYCQMFDNGTLVRNFVPCYRKADNVAGLYDLVNGVFYTNAGTGTFIVGGNV